MMSKEEQIEEMAYDICEGRKESDMTRYIDADELYRRVKRKTNPYGKPTLDYESGVKALEMIEQEPTADVVPKSEVKEAEAEIERLKHILDCYALQYGTVMDKYIVIEGARAEVAREIFEEIEQWLGNYNGCRVITYEKFDELKKKYTEDKK